MASNSSTTRRSAMWTMEGEWSASVRDVRNVQPLLETLKATKAVSETHYARINSVEDLFRLFKRWGQAQHDRFNLGYLGLHGSSGHVKIGRRYVELAGFTLVR